MTDFFLRLICMFIPGSNNRHRVKQRIKDILPSLSLYRQKFDLFVSLGNVCQISFNMRANKLQFKSYPFDWLCKGSINSLMELFNNDFQDFLNKSDLVPTERNELNLVVDNTRTGYGFLHDFQCDTIDEDYDIISEKYRRRFDRLDKSIRNLRSVLFVYRNDDTGAEMIQQLRNTLIRKYKSTKKINILWIVRQPNQKSIIKTKISDGIYRVTFDCDAFYGQDENARWTGNTSQYKELFQNYALTLRGYSHKNKQG